MESADQFKIGYITLGKPRMYENNIIPNKVPHKLFILKVAAYAHKNDFDLIIGNNIINGKPDVPDDIQLCELFYHHLYWNKPGFDIHGCLDYHYTSCEDKNVFLTFVKETIISIHLDNPAERNTDYRHAKVMAWFDLKEKVPEMNINLDNLPEKATHRFLLLYELGIIDHLTKEYFHHKQTLRTDTDFSRLISIVIGDPSTAPAIRKMISSVGHGNKSDPITKPGIKKIKKILLEYSIDLKRLQDKD